MRNLPYFRKWCYKVLPLVYDDSLSYYEVLCKVVDYINNIIDSLKEQSEEIDKLQVEMKEVQQWIANFDTKYLEELIKKHIANMIYVGISDAGYIIYYIPDSWNDITFNTTGLDITNEMLSDNGHVANYEFGRLVLSMYLVD